MTEIGTGMPRVERPHLADYVPTGEIPPDADVEGERIDPGSRAATVWRWLIALGALAYSVIGVMSVMHRSAIVPNYPSELLRYSPFTPLGRLFHGSPALLIGVFVATTLGAFVAGFKAWRLAHEGEAVKYALVGGILFSGLLVLTPPLISQDVYSYAAYGRMEAIYGINPYTAGPVSIADDPSANYVGKMWWEMPSVYGPAIQAATTAIAWVVRDVGALIISLKAFATLALWLGLWLLVDIARRLGRSPTIALVVVGWNPLVVIHIAGGGHNDIFMAVLLLAAFAFHLRGKETSAVISLGLASMVKFLAGVPMILYLVLQWREAPPERRVGTVGRSVGILGLMALVGYIPYWSGFATFEALRRIGGLSSDISIPSIVGHIGRLLLQSVGIRAVTDGQAIFVARGIGFAVFVVYFLHLAKNLCDDQELPAVWGRALLAYCLTTGYLLPWYLTWAILPLALVAESRALRVALLACFAYSFTQLPAGYVLLTPQTRRIGQWVGLAVVPVLVVAGVVWLFWYRLYQRPRRLLARSS